jgi:hypothetical protein
VDWVYNGAEIDGAKIVWARDMGPSSNRELLDYYPQRRVWTLDADNVSPTLSPYKDPVQAGISMVAGVH